jgi:aquaporin Z
MRTLYVHWPEYVIEALCLALFMVSAVCWASLLQHPASPLATVLHSSGFGTSAGPLMRVPMGLAMGLTAAALIYSPFGRRSGAHMNPAVTLAFFRLGRISAIDAAAYVTAQFAGGVGGVGLAAALLAGLPAHPSVNYVATTPGGPGAAIAFAAEATISFFLMAVVLGVSSSTRFSGWTGAAAAVLVAAFIIFEAPLSGMSMNPARTFGSSVFAHSGALWIYFTAPTLGMLAAAEVAVRLGAARRILCAKLHHRSAAPCIFRCGHMETAT